MCLLIIYCGSQQTQQVGTQGLRKISYKNDAELQQLRDTGAEIIVQEHDYVIVRTDSRITALSLDSEPIEEADLVQRFVHIILTDSSDLQKIANIGIDLWQVKGDTVIARAFDTYIEQLRQAGFTVKIIASDSRTILEKE